MLDFKVKSWRVRTVKAYSRRGFKSRHESSRCCSKIRCASLICMPLGQSTSRKWHEVAQQKESSWDTFKTIEWAARNPERNPSQRSNILRVQDRSLDIEMGGGCNQKGVRHHLPLSFPIGFTSPVGIQLPKINSTGDSQSVPAHKIKFFLTSLNPNFGVFIFEVDLIF